MLRPGVAGWEVDAAARESLVAAGYPEPMYALGHQLGRSAHDGGTVLAPRWDRYGAAPFGVVEERNVFTLEYGTAVPGRGYIGLEEDVLVTADGIEWLSTPQRELWVVALVGPPLDERGGHPGRCRRVVELGGIRVGQVENRARERSSQVPEDDTGIARVALRLEAVRVVGDVVPATEKVDAFLDRRSRELEPALVGSERTLGRIAVADSVMERICRGDDHRVLCERRELLDAGQPLGMATRKERISLDHLRRPRHHAA